jgi:hypothetical protein
VLIDVSFYLLASFGASITHLKKRFADTTLDGEKGHEVSLGGQFIFPSLTNDRVIGV